MPAVIKYQYRRFEAGDEKSLNDLYFAVTGRIRTLEQYRWQWLASPAGAGEIWIIEAVNADGSRQVIGHHGLIPLYFSCGDKDLLAGKTENTMVLPEFRRKILYPRYEKSFLEAYQDRFDLLFSTTGPKAALRQRKALGYAADRNWVRYGWVLRPGALIGRLGLAFDSDVHQNLAQKAGTSFFNALAEIMTRLPRLGQRAESKLVAAELSDTEAKEHHFFEAFWATARRGYATTPRRDQADLNWRFWDNPYHSYKTLVFDSGQGSAYAVMRWLNPLTVVLEDIVCDPNTAEIFGAVLASAAEWAADQGAALMIFDTTTDPCLEAYNLGATVYRDLFQTFPFSRRNTLPAPMLRKACPRGDATIGLDLANWYVTPFIF